MYQWTCLSLWWELVCIMEFCGLLFQEFTFESKDVLIFVVMVGWQRQYTATWHVLCYKSVDTDRLIMYNSCRPILWSFFYYRPIYRYISCGIHFYKRSGLRICDFENWQKLTTNKLGLSKWTAYVYSMYDIRNNLLCNCLVLARLV